jgi:hypothetical protein
MMASLKPAETAESFEEELQAILRPVRPSRKFVQTVRQRIHFTPPVRLAVKPPESRRYLLILGGVLSVSLLLITTVRAVFYLVNRSRV